MGKSKTFILIGIIIIIGTVGYYFMNKETNDNTEIINRMKTASEDYFVKYISVNDTTSIYKITLDTLKNSSEEYDLSGLENCDGEKTYANVTANFKTGAAKEVEIKLSCK